MPDDVKIPQWLNDLARDFSFKTSVKNNRIALHSDIAPIVINIELERSGQNSAFVYLGIRTTSWDLPGERTDANEFFSMMLAAFLRMDANISCSIWDIPHPAVPVPATEIYGRYLVPNQPIDAEYSLDGDDKNGLGDILRTVWQFAFIVPQLFDWTIGNDSGQPVAEQKFGFTEAEQWAKTVATAICEAHKSTDLGVDPQKRAAQANISMNADSFQYCWRENPNWKHYRCIDPEITIYKMPTLATAISDRLTQDPPWETLDGPNCKLFVSDETRNAAQRADIELACEILRKLQTDGNQSRVEFIPLEHDLIAASPENILFLRRPTDRKEFENERELIRKRHDLESVLLFPIVNLEWQESIDSEQFELLMLSLLKREPGVQRARIVSRTSQPDGGRDILCEWNTPPIPSDPLSNETAPAFTRRIIVQCKAYRRSVNKSDVLDIRDTLDHYDADGYFLAVSSCLTTPLTDHLDKMRRRGLTWTDWWTRTEIEERIAKQPRLMDKFPRVFRVNDAHSKS